MRRDNIRSLHRSGLKTGHYLRLSVADTGTGMDEETLRRATEPFFSTKGIGKGTGLGLSMVHGLAAQLGGGLTIDSVVGRGTTIDLWLPISATAPGEAEREAAADPAPHGRGVALLVDDEELVRMSTAHMLAELGYDVIEAGSAQEALLVVRGGATVDLVVTDHLMPGMSGMQLARVLKEERPGLPLLLVSGYAETEGIDVDLARLTKPFRSAESAASLAALPEARRTEDGDRIRPGPIRAPFLAWRNGPFRAFTLSPPATETS
ncbi:ATP-binding protein [Sphingomonas sp. MMS24-JH45]